MKFEPSGWYERLRWLLAGKLGACPRCMRASLGLAIAAWAAYGVARAVSLGPLVQAAADRWAAAKTKGVPFSPDDGSDFNLYWADDADLWDAQRSLQFVRRRPVRARSPRPLLRWRPVLPHPSGRYWEHQGGLCR